VGPGGWFVENPVNRTFFGGKLKTTDEVPGTVRDEIYFLATGLWPTSGRPAPHLAPREPYVLRDVGRSDLYSVVRPELEAVNGRWCHVLERPGRDRLWIDLERGCTLLRRETDAESSGPLASRYELGDHREVSPGVWLPSWIRNTQFDYQAPTEEARRRRVIDAVIEVIESHANDMPDEQFVYRPVAGTFRLAPAEQVVPGGLDHLDFLSGWVERYSPPSRDRPAFVQHLAGLPFILLIPLLEFQRRRARRRAPPVRQCGEGVSAC
jgi:hypothetical protein